MTQPITASMIDAVLSRLEDLELRLLNWGITTGALTEADIDDVVASLYPEIATSAMITEMHHRALIMPVRGTSPVRYRTRMAETVRLTARLRQLFPPQDLQQASWWERGRQLVADYRIYATPRRYPKRDIATAEVIDQLASVPGWGTLHGSVARAQIANRDLAGFQVRAAKSIFASVSQGLGRGVVVGAGTSSGKTLSFYLPGLAAVAESVTRGRRAAVHTLAIYPRKELLRDQLRDAVSTARLLTETLRQHGRRPIRIGTLYADTPSSSNDQFAFGAKGSWPKSGSGDDRICPYMPCPEPQCGKELIWTANDRAARRETLRCSGCGATFGEELALTRESLTKTPPDILFTTTEMLNNKASDPKLGRLMGWRGGAAPALMLLDEVHTYSGVHGAQVALLLRRWRHAVKAPVTFVGLSATLPNAGTFFAELTGLPPQNVEHVYPHNDEMAAEGREYALALRGDPVSGVNLLSTSIQTAMLFGRVLDPKGREDLYGSVGFLFTDDLDVTNRFYDNLRDAEGLQRGPRQRQATVLAGLRDPSHPFARERFHDGQSWDLVDLIGRSLDLQTGGLFVGRTSSQDSGVDPRADLVVCTASLEVGYNDPTAGLVLQHKAPRDNAAFIQRRGRAGRRRGTRPWTVIVLSDYGRDRLAYQGYDSLFSPVVSPRSLPVRNRYVLKIQGTQALMDWLAGRLSEKDVDPRRVLKAPHRDNPPRGVDATQASALRDELQRLLDSSELQERLARHLQRALDIAPSEVQALLWEPPRSILLSVVPTALRRLRSGWRPATSDPGAVPRSLLPEFLTRNLFEQLNVPNVWLRLPTGVDDEPLPVERALREAVPGRVSRRYGHRRSTDRTWLPLPVSSSGNIVLELPSFVEEYVREGTWQPATSTPIEVIRPQLLRLSDPPADVATRSQGIPVWGTQIIAPEQMHASEVPAGSQWQGRISSIGFATHEVGNPAEVRRVTTGANCETSFENGQPARSSTVSYSLDGQPAGMGFALSVDAMRVSLKPIDLTDPRIVRYLSSPAWRTLAFRTRVTEDTDLDDVANVFQRKWLALVYLTAFAIEGLDESRSAEQIHTALLGGAALANLDQIFQVLYRDTTGNIQAVQADRLVNTLTQVGRDPRVIASLDRHARLLWSSSTPDDTADLAQRAYLDTMSSALLMAVQRASPDAQDGDLIVDTEPGANQQDDSTIWLSETAIGGLGIVEQFARLYSEDPRRFWGLVETSLGPGDYEYVDHALVRLLDEVTSQPAGTLAQSLASLRNDDNSAQNADAALQRLLTAWEAFDGFPRHSAVAALSVRVLRPGSNSNSDLATLGVIRQWEQLEQRLGFEVDAQVIAYAVGAQQIAVPAMRARPTADQVFSMLWPRGTHARSQHLEQYQPYTNGRLLDRLLVETAHHQRISAVEVDKPDWLDAYRRAITADGCVELTAAVADSAALSAALRRVPAIAVDRDVLRLYGHVSRYTRTGDQIRAIVELKETVQ